MKTRIPAMNKIAPKPPKRYVIVLRNHLEGGAVGVFGPISFSLFVASSSDSPYVGEVVNRLKSSSDEMM